MNRFKKHILIPEIGQIGQSRLLDSTVAIVGCGALGCQNANNLIRAGVGKVLLADYDRVSLENIHRQILFDEDDARQKRLKVDVALKKLKTINSEAEIIGIHEKVTASNIESIIENVDVVIDGSDNIETRFIINDACIKHKVPWIYAAILATEGITMNIIPSVTGCFRCFIKKPPNRNHLLTGDTSGILNTAVSLISAIQSTEVIKILIGDSPRLEALHVDIWHDTWTPIKVKKDENCITCSKNFFEYLK